MSCPIGTILRCPTADERRIELYHSLGMTAMQIAGLESLLEGPNAFVFSEKDVTAGPKIISQFIEKNKLTSLEIKG